MSKYRNGTEEWKSLNRKLAPANLFIFLVALIAGICMLVMPWIDVRVEVKGDKISEIMKEESAEQTPAELGEVDFTEALSEALSGEVIKIPVNVYPLKMLKAATGDNDDMAAFMNSLIGKKGAAAFMEKFANLIMPAFMKAAVNVQIENAVGQMMQESGIPMDAEKEEQIEGYKEAASEVIHTLVGSDDAPSNPTLAKSQFTVLVNRIAAEQGLSSVSAADIDKAFEKILQYGTNEDGEFSVMTLIEHAGKLIEEESGSSGEGSGSGTPAEGEENTEGEDFQKVLDILNDPGSYVMEKLADGNQEDIDRVQTILLIGFIVMVAIPAFFWFLLALCAFLSLFKERKIVKTWYVKLFCIWSGLGVLLGNLAPKILPKFLSEEASKELTAMSIKFLGSGVVAGVCWVAILLCGWFYYNGKKKKIKRIEREN